MTMTPLSFASDFIGHWEDGGSTDPNVTHSMDPQDNGNWQGGKRGVGELVGSNHGVTAQALAQFRSVDPNSISRDVMHALTVAEAAQIALKLYYYAPKLDQLPWNAVMASLFDFGWGAGPKQAAKSFQAMVGAVPDGQIGPASRVSAQNFLSLHGEAEAAHQWADVRCAFYRGLNQPKFLQGWLNRTMYYEPGMPWWERFHA
jgi:lysozyme family protein